MNILYKISMDLRSRGCWGLDGKAPAQRDGRPRIDVVQNDCSTRVVELSLFSGDTPWQVPADASIAVRYKTPQGAGGCYDTLPEGETAWVCERNTLKITLAPQMMAAGGWVEVQVELIRGNSILSTFPFDLIVERDISQGIVEPQTYINWLGWMQTQVDEQVAQIRNSGAQIDATLSQPGQAADAAVTGAALAQKAPAGFGLGNPTAIKACQMDSIWQPGWYCGNGLQIGQTLYDFFAMRVDAYSDSYAVQTVHVGINYGQWFATVQRTKGRGGWQDWQWLTPPMLEGEAYLTTRRWKGSPVYTKLINCGAMPNQSSKSYSPFCGADPIGTIIDYSAVTDQGEVLPMVNANVYTASGSFAVTTTADLSDRTLMVQIWYV